MTDSSRVQIFLDLADLLLRDSKHDTMHSDESIKAAEAAQGAARVAADPDAHGGYLDKAYAELTSNFPLAPTKEACHRADVYRRMSSTYANAVSWSRFAA